VGFCNTDFTRSGDDNRGVFVGYFPLAEGRTHPAVRRGFKRLSGKPLSAKAIEGDASVQAQVIAAKGSDCMNFRRGCL